MSVRLMSALIVSVLAGSLAGLLADPAAAADAVAGEKVFKSQCALCHSPEVGKNRIGPSLFGIVGRHSGTIEGFKYSTANKSAGITWTPDVLDKYLTSPKTVVPGTIMTYLGLKNDTQRADLIAYLGSLH